MKEKFLPIGTVVLLKGATKRLMITGYCSATPENKNKVYDYVAYLFPEGNIAGDDVALFDHNQIETISHMGLIDEEFNNMNSELKKVLSGGAMQEDKVQDLPPLTPNNLNAIIEQIHSQGASLKSVSEPTAFNQEIVKKPSFVMPALGGNAVNAESNKNYEGVTKGVDSDISVEKEVGDGQPVLQLQPIFPEGNAQSGDGTSSATASSTMSGLTRL